MVQVEGFDRGGTPGWHQGWVPLDGNQCHRGRDAGCPMSGTLPLAVGNSYGGTQPGWEH